MPKKSVTEAHDRKVGPGLGSVTSENANPVVGTPSGCRSRFARFWHEFDNRVQVPPAGVFGPASRRPVHLYTQNEIGSLFQAAWTLRPKSGLRPATFYTLLGLLACTGLRISEALHLQTGDFDSAAGTLMIRRSKGGQSRYVPVKPSAAAKLQEYQRLRQKRHPAPKTTAFFLSETGQPLSYDKLSAGFAPAPAAWLDAIADPAHA